MTSAAPCKILLANASWHDETRPWLWGVRAGSRWPHMEGWRPDQAPPPYLPFPHFLAQATALLERIPDLRVLLVDSVAQGEKLPAFLGRASSYAPDVIFLEVSTPSIDCDLDTVAQLKALLPGVTVGLGGAHAPLGDPAWLAGHPLVDFACFGEYELTLEALMRARLSGSHAPVAGAHVRLDDGTVRAGEPRPPCDDLDSLPRYAYHHLPMHRYKDNPFGLPGPSVQVWASRGCPFGCTFCVWPQVVYGQRRFRPRSVEKVADEVEWLVKTYDFQSYYFDDDTTNVGRERTLALARALDARRLGVPWAMMARADLMDREILEALHAAGMRAVKYGVESASQSLLDGSGKALGLDKVKRACDITRELGIRMHLTFMLGLPGETEASARATMDLALELDPDELQLSLCTPFPGTRLHEQALANGWLVEGGRLDGFNDCALDLPTISGQALVAAQRRGMEAWRAHREAREARRKAGA
ncbi:hopanoid biosynthesis associated radical SAM protein HpnJ [Fundidesulfovibrio butyratiphilus]